MNINLTVGDYSGDGHEKSSSYLYNINLTKKELEKAHKKGCKELGLKWNFCEEYEDNLLPSSYVTILKANKFPMSLLDDAHEDESTGAIHLTCDDFAILYMWIASIGNPELEYKLIESEDLDIGGYGVFF